MRRRRESPPTDADVMDFWLFVLEEEESLSNLDPKSRPVLRRLLGRRVREFVDISFMLLSRRCLRTAFA